MNSLGVSPRVNYLYSDLNNGLILFQVHILDDDNDADMGAGRSVNKLNSDPDVTQMRMKIHNGELSADELHQTGNVRHEEGC